MMKKIHIFMVMLLLLSACSTLSIKTDYDTSYNFAKNSTYAVVYNYKEGDNTLVKDRIQEAIQTNINAKGYSEVDKNKAELIFVFHLKVTQMSDIRTDYQNIGYGGYGYGGGWGYRGYGGGMVVPHSTTYRWQEGQLIIDAYNPDTKKIVWRGVIKDKISDSSYTVEEKTKYINKVVTEVLEKFPRSGI